MKIKRKWILAGALLLTLCLVVLAQGVGSAQATTSAASATAAVERLIRSTRRISDDRGPFHLEEGPADEKLDQVIGIDDVAGEALILMQEEDFETAIPILEEAIRKWPTEEMIWEALGWSYILTERQAEASDLWYRYNTLRPESPKSHSLLAQLEIRNKNWLAVDTHLKNSLKLDPKNYDVRYWYAQNLFRLGRLEQAREILQQLAEEDPYRFEVKIELARVNGYLNDYEAALYLWMEIVEETPYNLEYRTELARTLMFTGSLEEADEECRLILAEDPEEWVDNLIREPQEIRKMLWAVMSMRADLAEISGEPEVIITRFENLIDEALTDLDRARLQTRLANRYVLLNRQDATAYPLTLALDLFEKAMRVQEDYVPWMNQYAQISMMAKNYQTANRVVNHILTDINPYNAKALDTRFELRLMENEFDAARVALEEKYNRYQPKNPYRYLDLARLEMRQGNYQNAMDALDRLEEAGEAGTVLTLLYHGLTESEWIAQTSTRRFTEHILALRNAGFTFIAPSDIPAYLDGKREKIVKPDPKPWLARQVDNLHYVFTGKKRVLDLEDIRPEKIVALTFDDGLRSAFQLGTPIAEEFGLTIGMFVITSLEELLAPSYCTWEEIRDYERTGAWEIGSHLHKAHTPVPVEATEKGKEPREVFPLANRVWEPERNRLENMRGWNRRVQFEFAESRRLIEERLGFNTNDVIAVAYPFGDIGHEEGSNISHLVNPVLTLVNEAYRKFQVGFALDNNGYTCTGDNMMMIRRYEPGWSETPEQLIENVMSRHPVFMARRMRAEIAVLMDKPFLADHMINLLRRDGYPESLLRDLTTFAHNRPVVGADALAGEDAERTGASRHRIKLTDLYISAAYNQNQSNEEIEQEFFEFRAGGNLNAVVGVEAMYRFGTIDQTVQTNIWFTTTRTENQSSTETRTETVDGVTSTSTVSTQTATTREVQTNRVEKQEYSADVQELRAALSLRLKSGASLYATLGQKRVKFKNPSRSESELIYSIAAAWKPYRFLQIIADYQHDIVPSARVFLDYDAVGLNTLWKLADDWNVTAATRYWSYDDSNSMFYLQVSSMWQILPRQGVWLGLEASTYTTDEDSDLYWTPYWDTRLTGVLRLRRAFPNYFFQFDLRFGWQKEDVRKAVMDEWLNLQAKAENDGQWSAGSSPDVGWDPYVGFMGTYNQRFWDHWDLFGNVSVNFLRDYSEHEFTAGVRYNF